MSLTPEHLRGIWPDADWENTKLHGLELPQEAIAVAELAWILAQPVWSSRPPEPRFDLAPQAVMEDPGCHAEHADRIRSADPAYALHVHRFAERWVVLDGLHRLAKAVLDGQSEVRVQIVSDEDLRRAAR